MRLTKRQLKRIIREEYSRLKRRGLIREMGEPVEPEGAYYVDVWEQVEESIYNPVRDAIKASIQDWGAEDVASIWNELFDIEASAHDPNKQGETPRRLRDERGR